MKSISILTFSALLLISPIQLSAETQADCPDAKQLESVSTHNKEELTEALEDIVPDTYGENDYGNHFSKWEVTTSLPFTKAIENKQENKEYYEQAKKVCGEEVAKQSWLVKLHFPLWEGKSENATDGQLFLAKSKRDGWFAWYRVQ
ncbi:hypothetical protein SAMN05421676_105124 [Salinibacillus kushneri]|uniref:Uncharacterized protein n=1 Tax=Salinibacillus kushneri TaxID=237682 RepID=A0A1I0F0B9_9BACI|nr:hypothetical protein [Salinibacillus kushneri]SET50434.1 hypothetical protein SAMN05421676_105124 [Salinibacillus kushneri]